jgi:tRNA 2-selenouridine synthase SelU
MFVKFENINDRKIIDVRTKSEFLKMKMTEYNIPVINELQHRRIKRFYPSAMFIIIIAIIKNKDEIKKQLIEISNNKSEEVIIACSRGRLRSPITYIYARIIGIRGKVLWGGLKKVYKKVHFNINSNQNNY